MKLNRNLFLIFLAIGWLLPPAAQAKIYIDINNVSSNSFPLALVPPVRDGGNEDSDDIGEQFTRTVLKDLKLMGLFRFIDSKAFVEDPKKKAFLEKDVDFASWAVIDALAVSKGWYRVQDSRITIEMHLFDVLMRKELMAKRYEGTSEQVDWMAHRYADQIMKTLTGQEGVFSTQIAFIGKKQGHKELFVMNFDGSDQRQLTFDKSIVLSPAWTKKGDSIYYTSFGQAQHPQMYRFDMDGNSASKIAQFPGMTIGMAVNPVNGLIATTLTKDGNPEIYLLNVSGKPHARLTTHGAIDVSASFSPDGQNLVFVSDRDGSAQVYRMGINGDNVKRLTFKGRNNTAPAWSPRGDKIVFAGMDTDGHFDIFSMNPDGSQMVRLTYDSRNNEEPGWAPDGQMITFSSNRNGRYQIYIMRPDGSHQTPLTSDPWDHIMPRWGPKTD